MYETNNFFHPLLCHSCKIGPEGVNLKKCSQCNMIQYCCVQHQKQDWPRHRSICHVIKSVASKKLHDVNSRAGWEDFKVLCILNLRRMMTKVEWGMFQFPLKCNLCFNDRNLEICEACYSFYICDGHAKEQANHDCGNMRLRLDIDLYLWRCDMPIVQLCDTIGTNFRDIKKFITQNTTNKDLEKPAVVSLLSESLSRPLTVYYALKCLQFQWPDDLVVHVIGGNMFETGTVQYWEVIKSLTPVKKLQLIFIGPEVTPPGPAASAISTLSCGRLYHEVSLERPHVVCAFNSGIHELSSRDTWGPSLAKILALRVPVVLTSFNVAEAVLDVDRFRLIDPELRVRQFVNPFGCLSPVMDPENRAVAFSNQILSVLVPSGVQMLIR